MKISQSFFILLFLIVGLFSFSTHATIVFQGGWVDGGLAPEGMLGTSFGFQSPGTTGSEFVEIESLGMYNSLHWDFSSNAVSISSEMSGGTGLNDFAWVQANWAFAVTDNPVNYTLDASVDLINTRFMRSVSGGHECLSPGCDFDWLYAGSTTGILEPGYIYVLELQPSVVGPSSFRLQVPEPATLGLMSLGLLGLGFMGRKKSA